MLSTPQSRHTGGQSLAYTPIKDGRDDDSFSLIHASTGLRSADASKECGIACMKPFPLIP